MDCVLYDFDETLTRRDTTRLFVRAMWQAKPLQVLVSAQHLFSMRRARSVPERLQAAKFAMFGAQLKGLSEAALPPIHDAYVAQVQKIIRFNVWAGLEAHLLAGRQVTVVTASPRMAVQAVFEGLPVTVLGTEFAMANGRFTGALDGPGCYGAHKVSAIETWAKTQDNAIRFIEAWTDSWSDAPMMHLAERRYWICPPCDAEQVLRKDPSSIIHNPQGTAV